MWASDLQGSGDPMTVYVTGDIHGGVDMQKLRDWDLGDGLTSDDYLIIAGDFGFGSVRPGLTYMCPHGAISLTP